MFVIRKPRRFAGWRDCAAMADTVAAGAVSAAPDKFTT